MQDLKKMQLGQIVDLIIDFNERQKESQKTEERRKTMKHYRFATPEETSAYARS